LAPPASPGAGRGRRELLALAGFVAGCLAIAGLGGAATSLSVGGWYQDLTKPPFNPPDQVFAPVWTALYLMMAVAAWRVWRHRESRGRGRGLVLFALQLALNLLWSCLFFGIMAVGAALIEIVFLWVAIVATAAAFGHIDRAAGWLMVPYAAWVLFAAVLNAAIWWLN
jgi:tryptophan-rich sensory protein